MLVRANMHFSSFIPRFFSFSRLNIRLISDLCSKIVPLVTIMISTRKLNLLRILSSVLTSVF